MTNTLSDFALNSLSTTRKKSLTMTTPAAPSSKLRRRGPTTDGDATSKARLFLALACFWPLLIMIFFMGGNEAPNNNNDGSTSSAAAARVVNPGLSFRKYMDRVDIMGYGPTHPRVAVVVVGEDRAKIISSIESVFRNTDIDRLFVVCAVMDGVASDPALVKELAAIDQGSVPHWHGLRPDMHKPGEGEADGDEESHGKKVHVLFSKTKQGVATSRADAVDFVSLLSRKHEKAGIKSPEEDLILLLMKSGAELTTRKWLSPVTSALIVPPPLMGVEDPTIALKVANAVSFAVHDDKATAFDYDLKATLSAPSAKDMALSNGNSFPSPALDGVATALRLDTYKQLPAQDLSLQDEWLADLDLSLNLWLCADGIDVIQDVTITAAADEQSPRAVAPKDAARFAAAWMDATHATLVFDAITKTHKELTRLEFDTMMAHARGMPDFPSGLQKKCRPFSWYSREVNMELYNVENAMLEREHAATVQQKDVGIKIVSKKEEKKPDKKPEVVAVVEEEKIELPDKPLEVPKVQEDEVAELPPPPGDRKKLDPPLSSINLEILKTAPSIDISFKDVSGDKADFPHKGAKDDKGNWGYVHDETALRKNPPAFEYADLQQACDAHDNTYKMLTEQVFVDFEADKAADASGKPRAKIFCLVYTIESGHSKIPAIRETWGPKCDGFIVGSNKTDVSINSVEIPHEGPEEYNNIWQKVRSMWSYIYDNYYEKYDWFHIGGDDLYLLVENMRLYLESDEILTAQNGGVYLPTGAETTQTPLFLGRRFAYMGDMNDIFLSGGSGYTMNKAALKALVVDGMPKYFPHAHTFSEDTMVARIFKKMGVFPYDTKDEAGGERYMPFQPGHHWGYRPPADISKDWYAKYSIDVKWGKEHCAKRSIAFHYIKNDVQKRLHSLLYNKCPK